MTNTEQKIEQLIEKKIIEIGYELYDVEYVKQGKDFFLRIYIENEKGISLDDCEKVSNAINDILDESDLLTEQYFLEVSSTGIEKTLKKDKHLERNIENTIKIKLFKVNGLADSVSVQTGKHITGTLKKFDKENITIAIENEEINIDRSNIAVIKTVYNWE